MSQLKGSGGKPKTPPSPVNTPDNLRSADTVEMVLGIGEGPIKGLTNGAKSFYVGDTVLQRQDGDFNFQDFEMKVYPGDHTPEMLKYRLGGESSNNQVGVSLAYGIPVTRQTQHGNIDAIDIRLVVSGLYKQVQEGKNPGVFDHTFNFAIRYKPVSSSTWGDWYDAGNIMQPNNPHVSEWDSSWSADSYQDGNGNWLDPQDRAKYWASSGWLGSILWYRDQLANQPGGAPAYGSLFIRGKTTSTYVKEFRIPVQRIPEPYQIQIQRLTPDSSLGGDPLYIAEVSWESFQTIDTTPKFYPNTAITQVIAKSTDQFSSIPQMWGEYDGLIVRVPTNYDPETHIYTGIWDGTWKNAWTNNPVWLLYEAIHNTTWGWSAYTPVKWSKYEAYDLAQVCDFILPNGQPRYTFNAYITDPMDGREFCRYMAGSFNSVIIDDQNGNIQILMDKDDPAIAIIGPESVIGNIEYSYTDVNTRFNDMTVVFGNPEIDYNEDRRRIFSQEQIDQHGRIPYDFIAVGCTNENEAVRKASRRMVSATTETEMATFKTNRIASYWKPYDIILITDPIKGYGLSGRFKSFSDVDVVLRDPIYLEVGVSYGIDIQGLSGVVSRNVVVTTTGWTSTLKLSSALNSSEVHQKAQFSLKQGGGGYGLPKPYRILSIEENNGEADDFQVMAVEVNRLKFAAEDNAEIVGEPIYSFPKNKEPAAPANVNVANASRAAPDGTMLYAARIDFTKPSDPYVTGFFVRYRQPGETEYVVQEIDGSGFVLDLPREGNWEIQVQTRNLWNQQSPWISPTVQPTLIGKQRAISGGGIVSATGFLNQIKVEVEYPEDQADIRYAVIFGNTVNNPVGSAELGKIDSTKFEHTGLTGVQTWYYWLKFEDNLGNRGEFTDPAGVGATTTQASGDDIQDGVLTPDKFEVGFDPVQSVSSLPTTGNYVGRTVLLLTDNTLYNWNGSNWVALTGNLAEASGIQSVDTLPGGLGPSDQGKVVFLKSDNKIYRWTGSAWIASTATSDLVGQIVEAQIANGALAASKFPSNVRPIEVLGALPSTGNTVGRQVYLTTDGKVYRWGGSAWTTGISASDIVGAVPSAIPFGPANPSSGSYDKLFMNTTDNKLYRWDGTSWTTATNGADITAGSIVGDRLAAGTIQTAQLGAGVITAEKLAADSVAAGAIQAGAVGADKIQANSIGTSKLFVGATAENLVINPTGIEGNVGWNLVEGTAAGVTLVGQAGWYNSGRYGFWLNKPSTSTETAWNSRAFPVVPGRKYSVRLFASGSTSTATGMYHRMHWKTERPPNDTLVARDGVTDFLSNGPVTGGSPMEYNYVWTAPANAYWAAFGIYNWANGPTVMHFADVEVKEQTTGVMIQDGAIYANHLTANSVTANALASNSVTTDALAANSVVAGKISVSNLAAINANLGAITAGSININNRFIVTATGATTIRSGTTGQRVEIDQNGGRVYDSAGTLRVRWGMW